MIVCCWSLFFGFPLACCSDQDETLATVMEYQTPAGTLFKNGNMCFFFASRKTFFQDIPHASNWLATILGAFFSSRPTKRFFLSVHPCEAHFESQSLQASVDTFDSESGSLDLLNIFSQTVERGCVVTSKRQATALSRMSELCNNTAEHSFALHS